jgi:hypothetical protein
LIAPVRLRAVASGLIIEKVRSIAMIHSSLQSLWELPRLYRRRLVTASDQTSRVGGPEDERCELQQFHEH